MEERDDEVCSQRWRSLKLEQVKIEREREDLMRPQTRDVNGRWLHEIHNDKKKDIVPET